MNVKVFAVMLAGALMVGLAVPAGAGGAADSLSVPIGPAGPAAPTEPAAAPATILYQGRLTDASGVPRAGTVNLVISLYASAEGGSSIWSEQHPSTPLTAEGIFTLLLGGITPFPATAWSDPDRWIAMSVDGDAELQPRLKVASVPFAIEANRLTGKRATDFDAVGAADLAVIGLQAQLKGSDASPPNQGSNQLHWNNLYGVPDDFADGVDNIGQGTLIHHQLQGLDADDHPQYALRSQLATTDNSPPNTGENRLHWDLLAGVPQPLVDRLIPASWLSAGVIDSTRIGAGQVLARHLRAGTITGDRLAPGAVGAGQIAEGAINSALVENSSLTGDDILNGTIAGADIQNESITTSDVANQSLLGVDLAAGAVGTLQLADGGVTGAKLADGTVPAGKLADGAVTAAKLAPGAVGPGSLAAGSVTGDEVADGSLTDTDWLDSPGIGFLNMPGFVDSVISPAGQTVTSLTMNFPAAGWVLLSADAQIYMLHITGQEDRTVLAFSDAPDVVADSLSTVISVSAAQPSDFYTQAARIQMVLPVPLPGPRTFYLNARRGAQLRIPSLHNVRMQGVYYRRKY